MHRKIGVVHGRFQPFHLDHLNYVLAAKKYSDYIIVGITNPDPALTNKDHTDLHRSVKSANPLNYYERLAIIRESLLAANIPYESFDIVPFPINRPELIQFYVPSDAKFFITIYDDWGRRKRDVLRSLGLDVVTLWKKKPEDKSIIGTDVRRRIFQNLAWEHLLPKAAVRVIKEHGLDKKIREAYNLSLEEYKFGSE